eukprot:2049550-Rhodomonas_salina.3
MLHAVGRTHYAMSRTELAYDFVCLLRVQKEGREKMLARPGTPTLAFKTLGPGSQTLDPRP